MPPAFVPDTADELTPAWLTDALRESGVVGDGAVDSAKADQINVGQGFAGRVFRVAVTYDGAPDAAPRTLIVKLPVSEPRARTLVDDLGAYRREIAFYDDLASDAGVRTPRRYFAAQDPAARRYVLLLEELALARVGDNIAGCSVEEGELVLGRLAEMHAHWWNESRLESLIWLPTMADDAETRQATLSASWAGFPSDMREQIDEHAAAVIEAMLPRWRAISARLSEPPWTLVHGDFRLDNLAFDGGASDPLIVFDWQLVGRGRGARDVAYFMNGVQAGEDPDGIRTGLLEQYHSTLDANGVRDYSFDELSYDARLASLSTFAIGVVAVGNLDFSSERARALAAGAFGRLSSVARRLELVALLERDVPV